MKGEERVRSKRRKQFKYLLNFRNDKETELSFLGKGGVRDKKRRNAGHISEEKVLTELKRMKCEKYAG